MLPMGLVLPLGTSRAMVVAVPWAHVTGTPLPGVCALAGCCRQGRVLLPAHGRGQDTIQPHCHRVCYHPAAGHPSPKPWEPQLCP